jgi:hypothetical protein
MMKTTIRFFGAVTILSKRFGSLTSTSTGKRHSIVVSGYESRFKSRIKRVGREAPLAASMFFRPKVLCLSD